MREAASELQFPRQFHLRQLILDKKIALILYREAAEIDFSRQPIKNFSCRRDKISTDSASRAPSAVAELAIHCFILHRLKLVVADKQIGHSSFAKIK